MGVTTMDEKLMVQGVVRRSGRGEQVGVVGYVSDFAITRTHTGSSIVVVVNHH